MSGASPGDRDERASEHGGLQSEPWCRAGMATGRANEGSVEQGPAWGTEVSELAAMGSSRTSRAIGRAEWGGGSTLLPHLTNPHGNQPFLRLRRSLRPSDRANPMGLRRN